MEIKLFLTKSRPFWAAFTLQGNGFVKYCIYFVNIMMLCKEEINFDRITCMAF